jgi:hypothetical protein
MEYEPILHSALNIYADEVTNSTDLRKIVTVKCSNQEVKTIIESFFKDVVNLDHNLFGWTRSLCKYGDYFLYLEIDEKRGITHVMGLPPIEVERIEGEDPQNPNYCSFQWNSAGMTFENWQIAHFRILGNDKYTPYGSSVLDPARRVWRQLDLQENAMMAYRVVRSPERRVFYIDVGHVAPEDVEQYILAAKANLKKNTIANDNSGGLDLRYNPLSVEEDYFIPTRGASRGTKIETLPGGAYTGDVDDVIYLRDKLVTAIQIPYDYLIAGGEGSSQTSLAQKDIRFANTTSRIQKSIKSELVKMVQIHLFALGYRGADLLDFDIIMNSSSRLAELQELESMRTKFDVASSASETLFSRRFIYENVFNISREEIRRIELERFADRKLDALLEAVAEEVLAEGGSGIGGIDSEAQDIESLESELGMGSDEGPSIDSEFGGTAAEVGAKDGKDGPEAGSLLAAPGKRDVPEHWHGKEYEPVKSDGRIGAARRSSALSKLGNNAAKGVGLRRSQRASSALKSMSRGVFPIKEGIEKKEELFRETLDRMLSLGEEEETGDRQATYSSAELTNMLNEVKSIELLIENEGEEARLLKENIQHSYSKPSSGK